MKAGILSALAGIFLVSAAVSLTSAGGASGHGGLTVGVHSRDVASKRHPHRAPRPTPKPEKKKGYPPLPPTSVDASDGTHADAILVVWSQSFGADLYTIYKSDSQYGLYLVLGLTAQTSYTDNVSDSGVHWYRISASNMYGESAQSYPDSGYAATPPPPTPTGVEASDGTYSSWIDISWSSCSDADGYKVYRADSQYGFYSLEATTSSTSYDDTVWDNSEYWYKVSAYNDAGESDQSDADSGFRGAPPDAPSLVRASDGQYSDRIRVTWDPPKGNADFAIYRADDEYATYSLVGSTSSDYYDDYVDDIFLHWYKVVAHNSYGESSPAGPDSGFKVGPPPPPAFIAASDGLFTDRIRIQWAPSPGATGYVVYRSELQNGLFGPLLGSWSVFGGNTYLDDTAVWPNMIYWYKVTARNSYGQSDMTGPDPGYKASP